MMRTFLLFNIVSTSKELVRRFSRKYRGRKFQIVILTRPDTECKEVFGQNEKGELLKCSLSFDYIRVEKTVIYNIQSWSFYQQLKL